MVSFFFVSLLPQRRSASSVFVLWLPSAWTTLVQHVASFSSCLVCLLVDAASASPSLVHLRVIAVSVFSCLVRYPGEASVSINVPNGRFYVRNNVQNVQKFRARRK